MKLVDQNFSAGLVTQDKCPDRGPDSCFSDEPASEELTSKLRQFMEVSKLGAATFYRSWLGQSPQSGAGRLRDLFPIPPLTEWPETVETGTASRQACFDFSNMCLGALNCLNTGMKPSPCARFMRKMPSAAQRETQRHVCSQVALFLNRVNSGCPTGLAWQGSFEQCEASVSPSYENLRSNDVDLPNRAATCDPSFLVSEELRKAVSNPQTIFPRAAGKSLKSGAITSEQRAEYVQLVARH